LPPTELPLPEPMHLSPSAEVALEDYAREVTRSARVLALHNDPAALVVALRLDGLDAPPSDEARRDILDFARELAKANESPGLGWS